LPADVPGFGLAMILVLYAYGGWNDAAFVAADVRHRRDLPRALILGTILISFIYLAVNAAYINGLGFHGARAAGPTIAAKLLSLGVGDAAGKVMCVLVMISALGAINGLLFTGSRLFTSLGSEHSIFALLGRWHPRWKAPLWSLAVQVAVALAMILLVGTEAGRTALNAVLGSVRLGRIPWEDYHGGFTTLFAGTAPVFWVFFLLTGVSVFVLRFRDRHVLRPFALPVPFFPVLPAIFCGMCLYGLYSAATYAGMVALLGVVPLAVGLPLYLISRRTPSAETTVEEPTR
jgi:amino acid transporter